MDVEHIAKVLREYNEEKRLTEELKKHKDEMGESLAKLLRKAGKDGYKEAADTLKEILDTAQNNCSRTCDEIKEQAKRNDTEYLIINVNQYVDFMRHIQAACKTVQDSGEVLFNVMMESIPDEQKEKEKPNKCFGMFDESDPVCFCCEYSEACRNDVGTINE